MNVWVRIVGVLEIDDTHRRENPTKAIIQSGLDSTVYRTKEQARTAQVKAGGIILEIDAKGLSEVSNEFGKDVLLTRHEDMEKKESTSTTVAICVACIGERIVPNYGPYASGTVEPQGDIMDFSSDEEAWLDGFAEQTGSFCINSNIRRSIRPIRTS